MTVIEERVATLEANREADAARLERIEEELRAARKDIAALREDLRELVVRHEGAKNEIRRIWAVIAGVAAVVGGLISQAIASLIHGR